VGNRRGLAQRPRQPDHRRPPRTASAPSM
jgi:hypothetical protein